MSKKAVIDDLKKVLANTYALYLKTQNYHWNVTGPNFISLHEMFEEQYSELAEAIDTLAERIRALGEKAPGSLNAYSKLTCIKDGDENADAKTMLQHLMDDHIILVKVLNKALSISQKAGDEATADLLIQRIADHEKAVWMLKSSL